MSQRPLMGHGDYIGAILRLRDMTRKKVNQPEKNMDNAMAGSLRSVH